MPTNCRPLPPNSSCACDELGHLLAARRAPGRPEIDDQHLAAPLLQRLLAGRPRRAATAPSSAVASASGRGRTVAATDARAGQREHAAAPSAMSAPSEARQVPIMTAIASAHLRHACGSAQLNQAFLGGCARPARRDDAARAGSATRRPVCDRRRIADADIGAALRLGVERSRGWPGVQRPERQIDRRRCRDRSRPRRRTRPA